jgi:hypothetical protein
MCGRVHPVPGTYKNSSNADVEVWQLLQGEGKVLAAPASKEVEAIPLELLLANPAIRLRGGQYMQYKGVAYKCTDVSGVKCAGGAADGVANKLTRVKAQVTADEVVLRAPLVVASRKGGACLPSQKTKDADTTAGNTNKATVCAGINQTQATSAACIATAPKAAFCVYQKTIPLTYTPKVRIDIEKVIYDELLDKPSDCPPAPATCTPVKGWV